LTACACSVDQTFSDDHSEIGGFAAEK